MICHRSICPKSIAIIKSEHNVFMAKVSRFHNAVEVRNHKEYVARPTKCKWHIIAETNAFSSPELKQGKAHGLATDVWSLGLLLNFILYETTENVWINNDHVEIEVPEGTSDWLLELLRSMLHYDMAKRYSISTVLEILKSSQKCIDVLGKYIPIGKSKLKLTKVASKLSSEKGHWITNIY